MTQVARKNGGSLSIPMMLTYSLASLPVAMLGNVVAILLPRYFASHLGVSLAVVGAAFATVRFIDIPIDPALGVAMDATRTPIGRYRFWMLLGVPILMLSTYMLCFAPKGAALSYITLWVLVMYLATSILGLAYASWAATLAKGYHERSRLFGFSAPVATIGSLIILFTPTLTAMFGGGGDERGIQVIAWLIIAVAPVAVILVALRVPEQIAQNTSGEKFRIQDYLSLFTKPALLRLFIGQMSLTLGPGWQTALYLFFATNILGFDVPHALQILAVSVVGSALGGLSFAQLAKRIGKHYALMVSTTGYALGLLLFLFVHHGNMIAGSLVMLYLGFMVTGFGLLVQAMMADVGDEIRLEQGKERIGLLYSLITLASKIAGAFAIGLTYLLLAKIGFKATEGVANTPAALQGLELSYFIGPISFVLIGGMCFIGWPLTADRHARIRAELDARDALFTTGPQAAGLELGEALAAEVLDPD